MDSQIKDLTKCVFIKGETKYVVFENDAPLVLVNTVDQAITAVEDYATIQHGVISSRKKDSNGKYDSVLLEKELDENKRVKSAKVSIKYWSWFSSTPATVLVVRYAPISVGIVREIPLAIFPITEELVSKTEEIQTVPIETISSNN